jgi:hypothetical protein
MRVLSSLETLPDPSSAAIIQLAAAVAEHPLFDRMRTLADVRRFMEHHVWAVWDFMTLLKSLQAELAPVTTPWRPRDASTARLLNEIVLGEESDIGPDGSPASHFEIYVDAMADAGADVAPITRFLAALEGGADWASALDDAGAPAGAVRFVRSTFALAARSVPERLAAFTLGREDIIPSMFRRIVTRLQREHSGRNLGRLVWYLERHVTVDSEDHGPAAARLFARICLRDPATRATALAAGADALHARLALWEATLAAGGCTSSDRDR